MFQWSVQVHKPHQMFPRDLLIKGMVESTHLINKMRFILLPEIEDIGA